MDVLTVLRRIWLVYFFIVAILMVNVLLFVGMLFKMIGLWSERRYSEFANWCTGSTWCFYPRVFEEEGHHRVVVSGQAPPKTDRVLVMANHIEAPDWSIVFWLAAAANHLRHLKVFAKKSISYVPLIGTGMRAMGTVFLSRSWERDRRSIEATFAHLRRSGLPYWLLTHPEGTRATPVKLEQSQAFAKEKGLPQLQHVLLPRIKGLLATLEGLRHGSLDAVLDVTICWSAPAGPLPFFFFGQGGPRTVHVHLREYRAAELPEETEQLKAWIYERWQEKDELVATFRRTGSFGHDIVPVTIPEAHLAGLAVWKALTLAVTAVGIWYTFF